MSGDSSTSQVAHGPHDSQHDAGDDQPDEWDKRIFSTGCSEENARLNDCYFERKDWRECRDEMEAFKECWKRQGNDQRTESKEA